MIVWHEEMVIDVAPKDKLEATRAAILEKGYKVKIGVYAVDIQNHSDVDKVVVQAISDLGQIDILVNNVRPFLNPNKYAL